MVRPETMERLVRSCAEWKRRGEIFPQIVADCIRLLPESAKFMEEEFGAPFGAAYQWAEGISIPDEGVRERVVSAIRKYALGAGVLSAIPRSEIERWLVMGGERNATHMFVVYDAHARETIHPYVLEGERVSDKMALYNSEPTFCILAIFSFARILAKQIAEDRPWHPD